MAVVYSTVLVNLFWKTQDIGAWCVESQLFMPYGQFLKNLVKVLCGVYYCFYYMSGLHGLFSILIG